MTGYVDIHAHVLPGIDDGPGDEESAVAMLRAAAAAGISTIAATPHLRSDFPDVHVHELAGRCQDLQAAIERERIDITLVSGAEVSVSWALEASEEELRLASYGQRGRDLLIETPATNVLGLDRILYELWTKGYRVTLAHPERNTEFRRNDSLLRSLVRQGVLLQINAESLLASRRRGGFRGVARQLCRDGLAHTLASDGHRAQRWRPVSQLADAVGIAVELVGADRAQWMASETGAAILGGTELPPAPHAVDRQHRWRLFRDG